MDLNAYPVRRLGWLDVMAEARVPGRVLVVDDDPDVRGSLERAVLQLGHTVRTAPSSEAADIELAGGRFDLCLLDVELPRMSGVEFLSWALARDPQMAVIMLTGVDSPEVAEECLDRGARTYLVKPVEMRFLRLAIRDALAMRALLVDAQGARRPGRE